MDELQKNFIERILIREQAIQFLNGYREYLDDVIKETENTTRWYNWFRNNIKIVRLLDKKIRASEKIIWLLESKLFAV